MLILPFLLLFQSTDMETYDALLRCAAFHTIESERLARNEGIAAGDAQKAVAADFAAAARAMLSDDNDANAVATDLGQRKAEYLETLKSGELRETAEQWTALELACKDLYPMLSNLNPSGETR
jgi:hypothetical protein